MHNTIAPMTQALYCYQVETLSIIIKCNLCKALVAIYYAKSFSEICIMQHPYLVLYAFYTIPISPIFKFEEFTSIIYIYIYIYIL